MRDRGPMIGFFLALTTAVFWGALPIAMKQWTLLPSFGIDLLPPLWV